MDSDLADAVQALKTIFEKRFIAANFGKNDKAVIARLKAEVNLPNRYASFLEEADPVDVETVTPPERIRFVPASELLHEQSEYDNWRKEWVVVAHSALLGDPYFLDTAEPDAEGDCPVMTAMMGTGRIEPVLCASSFVTFLQILAAAMEVAEDFADDTDPDDEHIFREALTPRIRVIDQSALREGHWTS